MANRKPLTIATDGTVGELPMADDLSVGNAAISAALVATAQTYALPATGGTIALTDDIPSGTRFIDGGSASSVYTPDQIVNGGGAGDF